MCNGSICLGCIVHQAVVIVLVNRSIFHEKCKNRSQFIGRHVFAERNCWSYRVQGHFQARGRFPQKRIIFWSWRPGWGWIFMQSCEEMDGPVLRQENGIQSSLYSESLEVATHFTPSKSKQLSFFTFFNPKKARKANLCFDTFSFSEQKSHLFLLSLHSRKNWHFFRH